MIQVRKESRRDKIKLTMRVKDEKGNPLHKALIILDSEGKHLGNYFTDKNGLIEFVLNPDFENKTVKYRERFENFEEVTGEIQLKKETYHEITIKRLPLIDFWLGVKEKRWFFTNGSLFILIIMIISLLIFSTEFRPEEVANVISLEIALYILISCSLLKGYLLPIINSVIGSFCVGIPSINFLFPYFFIYLSLGLIATFVARKLKSLISSFQRIISNIVSRILKSPISITKSFQRFISTIVVFKSSKKRKKDRAGKK